MSMPAYMVPCDVLRTFLMDYLDRRIGLVRRWQFWLHLALCPGCARYMRQYKSSVEFARDLAEDRSPPPEFMEHTREFLHKHLPLSAK